MTLIEGILFSLVFLAFAAGYSFARSLHGDHSQSRLVNDAEMIAKARRDK